MSTMFALGPKGLVFSRRPTGPVRRWLSGRRPLFALSIALMAASLSGCDMFGFRDWQWHQKLTVTVETPEGVKTGQSVTRIGLRLDPTWWGMGSTGSAHADLSGEAVVIDLGKGKYLFALLRNYSDETAVTAFKDRIPKPVSREMSIKTSDALEKLRATATLAPALYPLFVTFGDINDPASVTKVDPADLAATFGKGYRLNAVTLSITDEPVTAGRVKSRLPWLQDYYSRRLDGERFGTIKTSAPFANSLASGAFDTEKTR